MTLLESTPQPNVIPFSRAVRSVNEMKYLEQVLAGGQIQGDGPMTASCRDLLLDLTGAPNALVTTSGTHALELAAMLLDLGPGDEVIVPSFTFSSTAAAVAIRGATPVFVDIEPRRLALDPSAVASAVTDQTRAIFVVHYAGIAARMPALLDVARSHQLIVVEDNAHGLGATAYGRQLGTFGALAAQSFHATKNVSCGEGGALLINDEQYFERAEILREKGTDRSRFMRGAVDKYTWQEVGSSYLPSELQAAVLRSQLECFSEIQARRQHIWSRYARNLADWATENGATILDAPEGCKHPAHMFAIILPDAADQQPFLEHLKNRNIRAAFHYVPLDSSPAGTRLGRTPTPCTVTASIFSRLVRLPLYTGMVDEDIDRVIDAVRAYRTVAR